MFAGEEALAAHLALTSYTTLSHQLVTLTVSGISYAYVLVAQHFA
jgi:hypothetical protein